MASAVDYPWTGQSIAEVSARWRHLGIRVLDAPGDSIAQAQYPVSELYRYRDYDRSRSSGRLTGAQWDALARSMRACGWRDEHPAFLVIGKDGCVVVGEGNHRLAIAQSLGLAMAPVHFQFVSNACRPPTSHADVAQACPRALIWTTEPFP